MGCNGGRELPFLTLRVARAAPLNPTVRRSSQRADSGATDDAKFNLGKQPCTDEQ